MLPRFDLALQKTRRRAAELGKDDAVALCTAGIGLAFVAGELDDGEALAIRDVTEIVREAL